MSVNLENADLGLLGPFSDTSESSNDTDQDDGLTAEELRFKYLKKVKKLEYKVKKLVKRLTVLKQRKLAEVTDSGDAETV